MGKKDSIKVESDYHCDWKGKCKRKPYVEVYPLEWDEERQMYWFSRDRGWSYLCRWHFYLARLLRHKFLWCKVKSKVSRKEAIRWFEKTLKEGIEKDRKILESIAEIPKFENEDS